MSQPITIEKEILVNQSSESVFQKKESKNQTSIRSTPAIEPFFIRKMPLWKRTLDIMGAILGLILFSPLMLFISLLIKMVSRGPILFKQKRIGFGGELFEFLKFRTMKVDADTNKHRKYVEQLINGGSSKDKSEMIMTKLDDSNTDIIPFGKTLRITYLNFRG